jgi:hypothetical protein
MRNRLGFPAWNGGYSKKFSSRSLNSVRAIGSASDSCSVSASPLSAGSVFEQQNSEKNKTWAKSRAAAFREIVIEVSSFEV